MRDTSKLGMCTSARPFIVDMTKPVVEFSESDCIMKVCRHFLYHSCTDPVHSTCYTITFSVTRTVKVWNDRAPSTSMYAGAVTSTWTWLVLDGMQKLHKRRLNPCFGWEAAVTGDDMVHWDKGEMRCQLSMKQQSNRVRACYILLSMTANPVSPQWHS